MSTKYKEVLIKLESFEEKLENIYNKCDKMDKHIDVVENLLERFKPLIYGLSRMFCNNYNND